MTRVVRLAPDGAGSVRAALRPIRIVAALLLGLVMVRANAAPISITDDRGRTIAFDRSPHRIVSLLPSVTESVCALGACDRLIGTDRFSNSPASVVALPKLGGLDDAQIERIVALRPDVVLAAKSARVTDRLESLGLKVVLIESQSHADVRRSLATIARLLDTPAEADRVWASIERDLTAAAMHVPPDVRGQKVYFEVSSAPYAAGAGSFIGQTLARLGMGNAVGADLGPFPRLNPEYVVRVDPDIVMAAERALATMRERPGWDHLQALRSGKSCAFDAAHYELLIRPGPRLGEAATVLADCLAHLPAPLPP